ncbi:unnamed protein product [Caenorhabditis sp. 36 PRJEB53466]|nr:unnamed protein product [Caenorhabditis sp. 36 PRJEB53466]
MNDRSYRAPRTPPPPPNSPVYFVPDDDVANAFVMEIVSKSVGEILEKIIKYREASKIEAEVLKEMKRKNLDEIIKNIKNNCRTQQ